MTNNVQDSGVSASTLAKGCVAILLARTTDSVCVDTRLDVWQQLFDFLSACPLPSDEYAKLTALFRNALGYYMHREVGAARYELNALLRCL